MDAPGTPDAKALTKAGRLFLTPSGTNWKRQIGSESNVANKRIRFNLTDPRMDTVVWSSYEVWQSNMSGIKRVAEKDRGEYQRLALMVNEAALQIREAQVTSREIEANIEEEKRELIHQQELALEAFAAKETALKKLRALER